MERPRVRNEFWTILLVTIVTVLIWAWAAGETLENSRETVRLQFTAPDAASWIIVAAQEQVHVTVEGSKRAVEAFTERTSSPLVIRLGSESLPAQAGSHTLALQSVLSEHPDLSKLGVRIVECEPAAIQVDVDEMVRVQAEIRPMLPGVQQAGEINVEPSTAEIAVPGRIRSELTGTLYVNAEAEPWQLAALEADVPQSLVVNLTPPDALVGIANVRIKPVTATVAFTIRSQIRELNIASVRVQISATPENVDEYHVEVEPRQLRDVVIRADGALIRRIERESIPVVAFVHLTSLELEQQIAIKPVSYFMAMVPDGPGGALRGVAVDAERSDGVNRPTIQLKISERTPQ